MATVNLKHKIISALCKYLSLDSRTFLGNVESDVPSLCTKILKSAKHGDTLVENSELQKVFAFVERLSAETEQSLKVLTELNEELIVKSVVLGNGLTPSAADVIVFAAVHPFLVGTTQSDKEKLPHLLRWIDYIQSKVEFGDLFEPILLEKAPFSPPAIKNAKKVEADPTAKKPAQDGKEVTSSKEDSKVAKGKEDAKVDKGKEDSKGAKAKEDSKGAKAKEDSKGAKAKEDSKGAKATDKKGAVDNQAVVDKKKSSSEGADGKDNETSVSLLRIQVGIVRKASKHPSADSLLVEEIDVGESKHRQVVSGLAKHISPEQLTGRFVVLITNVKPSKLRDVLSEGLVLCASNQDHTVVEPLIVPEGAKIGECITFSGHEGKPEDVLNPKKKQLEKITPHLSTDAEGVATFKGIRFMTSAGPCKSSIPLATVK